MAHRTTRPTDRDDDRLTEYTREAEHGLVTTEKFRRESDLFGDERETMTDGGVATQAAGQSPDFGPSPTGDEEMAKHVAFAVKHRMGELLDRHAGRTAMSDHARERYIQCAHWIRENDPALDDGMLLAYADTLPDN